MSGINGENIMGKILKLAGIGCGGRTLTYFQLAARQPHRYQVVAAADPNPVRVEKARRLAQNPDFKGFASDADLLAQPKLADIMIIGTQDNYHVQPCLGALERGYDVLLEKPVATNLADVLKLEQEVTRSGRKVMVCHVLRFTAFYRKVKELLDSGLIGELVALDAHEGVGAFHQTHSYVRGHWSVTEKASPMIIAKCCHDMDILSWLVGRPCRKVASFGELRHFTKANAPAGATARCSDGCPHLERCPYNAYQYYTHHRNSWLSYIHDKADTVTFADFEEWLRTSPWGRCVYHCDNTAVDRQTVMLGFDGGVSATFTMTAFDHGRGLVLRGTKGRLVGGDTARSLSGHDITVDDFATGNRTHYDVNMASGGYEGHGGGDAGLMNALYGEMTKENPADLLTSIHQSTASHVLGFAAEEARLTGSVVDLDAFYQQHNAATERGVHR